MPRQLQLKDCSCVFMPSKDTTGSPAHFLSKTTACASAGNIVFIIAPIRKLRTLVSEAWNIHHESREAEEEQVMFDSDGILGQHYQDRRKFCTSLVF